MEFYQLELTGFEDSYQSSNLLDFKEENFYLRLTGPDMHPNDSFYIEVPKEFSKKSIKDVFDYVFPTKNKERSERKQDLEVDVFPELPSIYDYFADIIDDEKKGNVVIDWSVNFGPRYINLEEIVEKQCCVSTYEGESFKALHLIADLYDVPFKEYDDPKNVTSDKQEFRGLFLHYMIANHGLDTISKSQLHGGVKDAVEYCERQNLIITKEDPSNSNNIKIEMTNQGVKQINELESENNYYLETYEKFASVHVEDEFVDFDVEDGLDLRAAAMRYDEINPYRANMVINLFTGVFDEVADRYEEELQSDKFFAKYLGAAASSEIELTNSEFENVLMQGKGLSDEEF